MILPLTGSSSSSQNLVSSVSREIRVEKAEILLGWFLDRGGSNQCSAGCRLEEWMAVNRPQPEYLSVRSGKTLYPLVAFREDPVVTVTKSDKMGGFQLIALHRRVCLLAS